ncbi:hypothetical protein [Planomonospora parontospora]|uniref:hypothetical protein n=1 Tax=Planomonospora parontospora TaxID=58119 RepID=UPI001670E056|nr:hypothetical protein [Planomonospora parontospora]GGL55335.1 hypothetical protein GCM10014719_65770 [Planomonospora parontospora subsp. antibiotica]GII19803.1 hypothetical protein Ppa05_65290 [Planomonospora parontospora subsp. antibiotica]
MTNAVCPACSGPGDYGPGPCPACCCRACQGAAFFGTSCTACTGTGLGPDAVRAAAQERAPGPGALAAGITADELAQLQREAASLAVALAGPAVLAEAELAVRGLHPVSVAHGDAETDEDARLIYTELPALAARAGTVCSRRGGNDYSTFLFTGPDAARAAEAFSTAVHAMAPSWWRVTPTAQPVYR